MAWYTALVAPIATLGSAWLKSRTIRVEKELEIKRIKAIGEIEQAKAIAQLEASYDNIAQSSMRYSLKDEVLLLLFVVIVAVTFFTPYLSLFFETDLTPQLKQAWQLLGEIPEWFQWAFMGIIMATFGLRWMKPSLLSKMPKTKEAKDAS